MGAGWAGREEQVGERTVIRPRRRLPSVTILGEYPVFPLEHGDSCVQQRSAGPCTVAAASSTGTTPICNPTHVAGAQSGYNGICKVPREQPPLCLSPPHIGWSDGDSVELRHRSNFSTAVRPGSHPDGPLSFTVSITLFQNITFTRVSILISPSCPTLASRSNPLIVQGTRQGPSPAGSFGSNPIP